MTEQSSPPEHECDLVMQGAVASGVVYPPVILRLKEYYRLRNIGGTSAGAIAATGAAAAEFNREKNGFEQLRSMRDWLGADRNLRNLFQPTDDTKPLMYLVDAIFPSYPSPQQTIQPQQMTSKLNALQSMFQIVGRLLYSWRTNYPRFSSRAVLGAMIGVVLFAFPPLVVLGLIALFTSGLLIAKVILGIVGLLLILIGAWLGYQVGGVVDAIIKLPKNFYGICTGYNANPNVLTNWLSNQFNQMAGMEDGKPLTFGHLRRKRLCKNSSGHYERCEDEQNGQDVGITLRMITSNLSQGQPYVLPTGLKGFLFKEDEMRKLFPKDIVDYMVTSAAEVQNPIVPINKLPQLSEGKGYHFLPDENHLPVVVAMRLSLSFPILLSAIPLYTIKPSAIAAQKQGSNQRLQKSDMQINWFSDGGICDNFPIEFFDIWLPTRPTFGISLTSMSTKEFVEVPGKPAFVEVPGKPGRKKFSKDFFSAPIPNDKSGIPDDTLDVYLPRADAPPTSQWHKLEDIGAFLSAILSTGLGWYWNLQANLTGYRDRVVQIRMDEAEGGLHLNMPQEVIEKLLIKGGLAGDLLIPGNNPEKFNFAYHEWVRYRVLMAKLEENFEKMRRTLRNPLLTNPLTQPINNCPYPPPPVANWLTEANARLQALECLLTCWQAGTSDLFRKDEPQPETALRVTPDV